MYDMYAKKWAIGEGMPGNVYEDGGNGLIVHRSRNDWHVEFSYFELEEIVKLQNAECDRRKDRTHGQ